MLLTIEEFKRRGTVDIVGLVADLQDFTGRPSNKEEYACRSSHIWSAIGFLGKHLSHLSVVMQSMMVR